VGGSELLSSSSSYYSSWRFWKGIESAPISSSSLVFVRGYKRANRKVSVVLREQTKHLGKKSEVVSVKPGRARNHLIPLKLAKYATEENVAEALREKEERDGSEEEEEEVLDEDEEKKVRLHVVVIIIIRVITHRFLFQTPRDREN
jgi:large subunit ribosomal protein L9